MSYWTFDGKNGLAGVNGTYEAVEGDCFGRTVYHPDPDNPAVLSDENILFAIRTSRRARDDFRRIFPTLLPAEQARLTTLLEENPRFSALITDEQLVTDRIQAEDVRSIPVRTSGPRGGTLYRRSA